MTQVQNHEAKIYYDNVVSLLMNCIENRDLRLLVDILQDLARRFGIYLKLRTPDIALVMVRDDAFDNGVDVIVLNKYGLEITVSIFKTDKYVSNVQVSYVLVNPA
jgi:hypothetical protein